MPPKLNFIVSVKGPEQVFYISKDRMFPQRGSRCTHVIAHAPSPHFYIDDKLTEVDIAQEFTLAII